MVSDFEPGLDVIYDGECIFCASYTRMVRLRQSLGEVRMYDARQTDMAVRFPEARHYDLNEGMLVRWEGSWFHGAEAVWLLSVLSTRAPLRSLLARRNVARALYPSMRAARNLTLFLRGKRFLQ
ncbi:DCC1-like thiol-disulfide oxidoreductase family protein [Novosphingobium sp. M1R2S20]|uniref:DCC1-like thiol-disulfide oxidoreductase family protein n=1 Tax=Novosphingobium rhizovicinum TaxID=3228928 RepID=A0ABV3R6V4_9SPHN